MNNRLIELDVLRGLSVFGMILVINPGNWSHQFAWMRHAEWQGYPLSDMIFPAFLFCIGVSMTFSFSRKVEKGASYGDLVKKSLLRSMLMILIGLFINSFPYFDFANMRIPGVIQRIGVCYLIASNIYLFILFKKQDSKLLWLALSAGLMLVGYYVLLAFVPISGMDLTLDGLNLWPMLVDQQVFGIKHIWPYGDLNGTIPYDPDGLLASVPASVNILFGLMIGVLIKEQNTNYNFQNLLIGALGLMTIGFLLDYLAVIPMIKKLWTSSFVLYSTGVSVLFLAVIKLALDNLESGKKIFYPLLVFGSNALLAFVVSYLIMSLMDKPMSDGSSIRQIGFDFFQNFTSDIEWASFLYSLVPLVGYFVGLQVMYKRRWYVRL